MAYPPLELTVNVTSADGAVSRWHSNDPKAANRPRNLMFGSQRMTGFSTASMDLSRRIDVDYPDLNLFDDIAVVGADGSTAWEGRIGSNPRTVDQSHTMSVQCAGWMAHASDRKFTMIYVDRDLNAFTGEPSNARRATLLGASYFPQSGASVKPDSGGLPGLVQQFDRLSNTAIKSIIDSWYDAGPGNVIGAVYADLLTYNNGTGALVAPWMVEQHLTSDDAGTTGYELATSGPGSFTGYYTATGTDRRYLNTRLYYNGTFTGDCLWAAVWRKLAVYGNHSLTRYGATDPQGLYASDVIKHIIGAYCPKLNATGVQATGYPISHLVFRDPISPYDAFLEINKYHLWELGCWENKTVTYAPVDLTDYDWEIRLDDPGVTTTLQGDSTENLANGIAVTFTNVQTGVLTRLLPSSYPELQDMRVSNPATRHGLTVWTEYQLTAPATLDAALQLGRAALAEFNQPQAPGTITTGPYVRDRGGHWQQAWKVRAGDRVAITSSTSLSDRPRVIHEVSYTHGANGVGQASLAVDSTFKTLPAVLDRILTALQAAGLA